MTRVTRTPWLVTEATCSSEAVGNAARRVSGSEDGQQEEHRAGEQELVHQPASLIDAERRATNRRAGPEQL
jgi:hypothetical protein